MRDPFDFDDFDTLVAQGADAPVTGWDFGWLDGRATEARPSWHYFDRVAERIPGVSSLLDVQAGTGHLLADLPTLPALTVAAEGYGPNVAIAAARLSRRGITVVRAADDRPALPLVGGRFELVVSRHPVQTWWFEIARVLAPGGTYLAQHVGPHSLRDLSEFLMGPLPAATKRDPGEARQAALAAGLDVVDLRVERPEVTFFDVGAVVYFLRLVVWTVPDFTVTRYRDRLRALHDHITAEGAFRTTSSRVLIEARRAT